jgi:DNA-binding transcriptional MerR regulator
VRKANGYREYSLRDAVELARVRRLTELGLSLDEVGDALAGDASRDLGRCLAPGRGPATVARDRYREDFSEVEES